MAGVIWSWDWSLGQVSSTAVFSPLTYCCLIVQVKAEAQGGHLSMLVLQKEMPGPEGWTKDTQHSRV